MARVLVIEDNGPNLDLMSYLLQAHGHEVIPARDGGEGLDRLRAAPPDLIVCDIHLPRIDGYEVARRVKGDARLQSLPLVAVTALAMVGDREKVLAAGFDGYIAKPIVPETFVAQLQGYLSTPPGHAPQGHRSAAPSAAAPAPKKHSMILVVDDVAVNLEVIRNTLEPFGFEVRSASTVSDALALAERARPDLILSDLHLRQEHGFDLFKAVKARPALGSIPFVFISASVWGGSDEARARAMGADGFIMRPIAPEALLEEIRARLPRKPDPAERRS